MGCGSSRDTTAVAIHLDRVETDGERVEYFTNDQKESIVKTWVHLSGDLTGNGSKVFLYIFDTYPFIQTLFPEMVGLKNDELLNNHNFRFHSARFMQAVGAVVENLDDPDSALSELLVGLGRQHTTFGGFEPEYFSAFETSMSLIWSRELGTKYTELCEASWCKLFSFIMQKLKDGYNLQKMDETELALTNKE